MDMIVDVINSIDAFVWGPPMLVLLLGSHIFLTFRTGFIQRRFGTIQKRVRKRIVKTGFNNQNMRRIGQISGHLILHNQLPLKQLNPRLPERFI